MLGCIQPMSSPMMNKMFGLLAGACAIDNVEVSAHATIAPPLHALLTFICSDSWRSGDKPLGIDLALAQDECM
jgi:hypothetical protein